MARTVNWLVPAGSGQFECVYVWSRLQRIGRLKLVYTAAFFRAVTLSFEINEDEFPDFSDVRCQLHSSSLPALSHTQTLIPKRCSHNSWLLTTHVTEFPKHSVCFVEQINREGRDQTQRCEQRQGDPVGSVSLCHRVKEPPMGAPSPPHNPPPASPTWSSHLTTVLNELWEFLTTIWLAPLQRTSSHGQLESTLPYTEEQARKGIHQHSSQRCMNGKLEMTSLLQWTDSEQFAWSVLELLT